MSKIHGDEVRDDEGFFETAKDFQIPQSEYLFIDFIALDYAEKCKFEYFHFKIIISHVYF